MSSLAGMVRAFSLVEWGTSTVLALRVAWLSGKTPSQIAAALGPNFTRAAVLAKVDDLDLDSLRLIAEPIEPPKPEKRRLRQNKTARDARARGEPLPDVPGRKSYASAYARKSSFEPRVPRHDAGLTFDERALVAAGIFTGDEIRTLNAFPHIVPAPIGEIVDRPPISHAVAHLRSRHCRFPIGTPGEASFHFCCRPRGTARRAADGSARPVFYCEEHMRVSYQETPPRRSIVPQKEKVRECSIS